MTRIALAAVAALLAAPMAGACAPARPDAAVSGKMRAPVDIQAKLSEGSATVTVRFERAARNVRVQVGGLDGLAVTSEATPLEAERVEAGEVRTFDVAFTPGPGRSLLRVAVTGRFGGGRRAATMSFAVGEPMDAQRKGAGTVIEGPDGERVKVLPSGG